MRRQPGWVWRWCHGSVLAMGPSRRAVRLDGAAALVFSALDRPARLDEVVALEADRWDTAAGEPAELAADAVEELRRQGLVLVEAAP